MFSPGIGAHIGVDTLLPVDLKQACTSIPIRRTAKILNLLRHQRLEIMPRRGLPCLKKEFWILKKNYKTGNVEVRNVSDEIF